MSLIIDQDNYEYVLSVLGYPVIDHTELGTVVTEQAVKNFCILPSVKEYFRWFPIEVEQSVSVGGSSSGSVDFPDQFTFSIRHTAFTSIADSVGSSAMTSNPWINSRSLSTTTSMSSIGSRFNYGMSSISKTIMSADDTMRNSNRVFRTRTDEQNRKLEYYCNEEGHLEIVWAKWSEDFTSIPFRHQRDVLELSQAELLLWTAGILGQINPEFPSEFDYDSMQTKGEDLKEKIMTKWKEYTKSVVIK